MMPKVIFQGRVEGQAACEREVSLLAASQQAGTPVTHRCGGHARCGTCLVTITLGGEHLSEPGTVETRVLAILKAGPGQRLACQAWARGDVSVST